MRFELVSQIRVLSLSQAISDLVVIWDTFGGCNSSSLL